MFIFAFALLLPAVACYDIVGLDDMPPSNVSCYCNPENTTVACNNSDVQPLQESSLIPDNAQYLYISSNRIKYDHIGQGNFTRTLNITEIIFRNCGVAEILPASFRPLKALKHFELAEEQARPVILRDDAFAGADMESVFLHKLHAGLKLTENSFRDAFIRTLVLVLCKLEDVPKLNHQTISDSLTTLYLSQNQIQKVKGWTFAGLKSLKRIYLDNNSVKDLESNAFAGVELELLDMNRNKGMKIRRSSFQGARIKKLLLGECDITTIDSGSLSPLGRNLIEIDLSGNGLIEIDSKSFAGLINLEGIDLSNNSGIVVKSKSFTFSDVLYRVDFSDCPNMRLETGAFCRSEIEELYLSRSVGQINFDNIQALLPLLEPQESSQVAKLKILDLTQCGIRSIAKSNFWKLALAMVQDEIRLAGNPIECNDPQNAVVVSRFKEKLMDICSDLRKYALIMPQMHSELLYDEQWMATAMDDECKFVSVSDTTSDLAELSEGDLSELPDGSTSLSEGSLVDKSSSETTSLSLFALVTFILILQHP